MKKFEYEIFPLNLDALLRDGLDKLNEKGNDGWEAVTNIYLINGSIWLLMKREKDSEFVDPKVFEKGKGKIKNGS